MLNFHAIDIEINQHLICEQLTLQINSGEIWGILGANGSGKTTLLHSLANLHALTHGEILLNQKNISHYSPRQLAQKMGLLLQDTPCDFPATVYDTVLLGRYPQQNRWSSVTPIDHEIAQQALNDFELTILKNTCITKISGGEKRRVALALLAAQQPDIYLLDEPTNHLDVHHQLQVLNYFARLHKTIVMSLHDVNLAKRYCSHVLLLSDGGCLHGSVDEVLTQENLEKIFAQKFTMLDQHYFFAV